LWERRSQQHSSHPRILFCTKRPNRLLHCIRGRPGPAAEPRRVPGQDRAAEHLGDVVRPVPPRDAVARSIARTPGRRRFRSRCALHRPRRTRSGSQVLYGRRHSHLAIYVDKSGKATRDLGTVGVPATLLIDRDGRELGRLVGPAEWDEPDIVRFLKRFIERKAGSVAPTNRLAQADGRTAPIASPSARPGRTT
jgi:hypothetical protein